MMQETELKIVSAPPFFPEEIDLEEDVIRFPEMWDDENEKLLTSWVKEWCDHSTSHQKQASVLSAVFFVLSLLGSLVPVVFLSVSINGNANLSTAAFTLTAVCNAANTLFKPDSLSMRNQISSDEYEILVMEAREILAKQRKYRSKSDITISTFKNKMSDLIRCSPSSKSLFSFEH